MKINGLYLHVQKVNQNKQKKNNKREKRMLLFQLLLNKICQKLSIPMQLNYKQIQQEILAGWDKKKKNKKRKLNQLGGEVIEEANINIIVNSI